MVSIKRLVTYKSLDFLACARNQNEQFSDCRRPCSEDVTCETRFRKKNCNYFIKCSVTDYACVCKPGFVRTDDWICVPELSCEDTVEKRSNVPLVSEKFKKLHRIWDMMKARSRANGEILDDEKM